MTQMMTQMMTQTATKPAVIIPTFNRCQYLRRLLQQLHRQTLDGDSEKKITVSIVVVVDGSTDGNTEMLAREFPGVGVVRGTGDWWWTRSINEGCKRALRDGADALLLMNDDTEVDDTYLHTLLAAHRRHPDAVIGSLNLTRQQPYRVYFAGVEKIAWWRAKLVLRRKVFSPHDPTMTGLHPSVALLGRGMFIPATVFDTTGFFDEARLPQYKADFDFVLTAHEKGIPTLISWDAVVYSYLELTGDGATYTRQSLRDFLASFVRKNSWTNLVHSYRYYRKHCPLYLLPFSFVIDKLRLLYAFARKRKQHD